MSTLPGLRAQSRSDKFGALALLLGGISSFQLGAALAKSLFPFFGAQEMVGLRVCLAALILLAVIRPKVTLLTRDVWRLLLPYSFSIVMMNFGFYIALERLPLGLVVSLEILGPLSLALIGSRRLLDLFWTALVLVGIGLLLRPDHHARHLDPVGVVAALCAALGWGLYIITGSRLGTVLPAAQATTVGMSLAGLMLLPWMIAAIGPAFAHPYLGLQALCVAVLSSAVPYVLDMMAMRQLSTRDLGILSSLEPVSACFFGLIFLGESFSPGRLLGVIFVAFASVGNVVSTPKPQSLDVSEASRETTTQRHRVLPKIFSRSFFSRRNHVGRP